MSRLVLALITFEKSCFRSDVYVEVGITGIFSLHNFRRHVDAIAFHVKYYLKVAILTI